MLSSSYGKFVYQVILVYDRVTKEEVGMTRSEKKCTRKENVGLSHNNHLNTNLYEILTHFMMKLS